MATPLTGQSAGQRAFADTMKEVRTAETTPSVNTTEPFSLPQSPYTNPEYTRQIEEQYNRAQGVGGQAQSRFNTVLRNMLAQKSEGQGGALYEAERTGIERRNAVSLADIDSRLPLDAQVQALNQERAGWDAYLSGIEGAIERRGLKAENILQTGKDILADMATDSLQRIQLLQQQQNFDFGAMMEVNKLAFSPEVLAGGVMPEGLPKGMQESWKASSKSIQAQIASEISARYASGGGGGRGGGGGGGGGGDTSEAAYAAYEMITDPDNKQDLIDRAQTRENFAALVTELTGYPIEKAKSMVYSIVPDTKFSSPDPGTINQGGGSGGSFWSHFTNPNVNNPITAQDFLTQSIIEKRRQRNASNGGKAG